MQKVLAACTAADEEVQESALHCLRDIATQEYEYLELYFAEVCQVTEASTKSESSRVGA